MTRPNHSNSFSFALGLFPSLLIGLALVAIAASFVMANSVQDYETKSRGFSAILVGFLIVSFAMHYLNSRKTANADAGEKARFTDARIAEKLFAIEEAGQYFGGTVKSADVFRLISSKIGEIIPTSTFILGVVNRSSGSMRIVQAQGENAANFRDREIPFDAGVAGRCFSAAMVQIDRDVLAGNGGFAADGTGEFRSSAAIPLIRSGEVFAILQLFSNSKTAFDVCPISVFDAIGERVAPLVFSSLSFERSHSNALTDPVTDLPNERAFHLILENQIAETQRNPVTRPLTVLAIDIKGFDEINSRIGHAAGDRILMLVAQSIRGHLRQMDFMSRSENDEFLVIMPTANQGVAEHVIGRMSLGLASTKFYLDDNESTPPELNFGVACFGADGESAHSLVLAAQLRKQQSKSELSGQLLWFPKDFVS